jgi:amino acid transporter
LFPPQQPSLGVVSATTLVAASMIGVGVYTTSGYTLAALGSPSRVIAAWIVGGLIAICGAIGYGALANRFTESGGEYMFLSRTLHPVAGLVAGWVSLLAGFTGAIAIAAIGLEEYLVPMVFDSSESTPPGLIAIAAVLIAAVLHTIGVQSAARAQDAVVIIKLLLIGGFIVFALRSVGSWPNVLEQAPAKALSLWDFAGQLVWISFSYAGFNAAVYIAGEVREPERNVARAMLAGTVLVTLIYVALNTIFVLSTEAAVITGPEIGQVAATAATTLGGAGFANFVRGVIIISLFTSVSALVMTGPRVYAKMADDGFFPRFFRFEDKPPVIAIWFQAILAVIVISISELKSLLGYLGLTLSVCSALTVSMLFVLKLRGDKIHLPWFGIAPAIYVLGTLLIAVMYGIDQPAQAGATAATIAVGLILYPFIAKRPVTPDSC